MCVRVCVCMCDVVFLHVLEGYDLIGYTRPLGQQVCVGEISTPDKG